MSPDTNRKTQLRFDNFMSEPIPLTNRIGQGDPLSMLLYTLYNTDLLDLPDNQEAKDAIGYIDNIALIAIRDDLTETTN